MNLKKAFSVLFFSVLLLSILSVVSAAGFTLPLDETFSAPYSSFLWSNVAGNIWQQDQRELKYSLQGGGSTAFFETDNTYIPAIVAGETLTFSINAKSPQTDNRDNYVYFGFGKTSDIDIHGFTGFTWYNKQSSVTMSYVRWVDVEQTSTEIVTSQIANSAGLSNQYATYKIVRSNEGFDIAFYKGDELLWGVTDYNMVLESSGRVTIGIEKGNDAQQQQFLAFDDISLKIETTGGGDTTPPVMAITSPTESGNYNVGTYPGVSITYDDATSCGYSSDNSTWTAFNSCTDTSNYNPSEGSNTLYIQGIDSASNMGTADPVTFSYDSGVPTVEITYPVQGGLYSPTNWSGVSLSVAGAMICRFSSNNADWTSFTSCSDFSNYNPSEGVNTLYVQAIDAANNIGVPSITPRTFNYTTPPVVYNISNNNGSVAFPINIGSLLAYITFRNNFISVDVNSAPSLNVPANITFTGMPGNFVHPQILRNGAICTDCINYTSLNAETVRFGVQGFSNYTIGSENLSVTLITPTNGAVIVNSANFTANISDNLGIANYTLSIYNNTGVVSKTTILTPSNPVAGTVGIVTNLVSGVYHWFYSFFGVSGNSITSENNSVNVNQCVGNVCNLNLTLNISNSAPTIVSITNDAYITLTGNTNTNVYIQFIANDDNGNSNLNGSSALVTATNTYSLETITSSSCAVLSVVNVSATEYNCTLVFPFYTEANIWDINASIADNEGLTASLVTTPSTVNALNYVLQDITTVAWNSVTAGTNDNEANSPVVITNGGNQAYNLVSVTAYNATDGVSTIAAESFSGDSITGATTGQNYFIGGTPVQLNGIGLLIGPAVSDNIYFYVDLPLGLTTGTYSQTNTWALTVA